MPRATVVLAGLAALVVCAWFALGIRQSTGLNRAEAILGSAPRAVAPAREARAQSLLDEAALLNPDRTVVLERAVLDLDRGRDAAARSAAAAVTRAEPQNLEAWVGLAQTAGHDPRLFRTALQRVRELEPRLP